MRKTPLHHVCFRCGHYKIIYGNSIPHHDYYHLSETKCPKAAIENKISKPLVGWCECVICVNAANAVNHPKPGKLRKQVNQQKTHNINNK